MELYQYKAVDGEGRVQQGRLEALNIVDLEVRLSRLGLDLINQKEVKLRGPSLMGRGVKRTDLIGFCFHLEQLMEAGVPILEALGDLKESVENPRMREITSLMIESIQGGKSLSETMRDYPSVFSRVFVSLIKVGEETGRLTQVLRSIVENLKWQDEQAAHAKKLFIYPAFVGVVVLGVVFFLMIYLVPELLKFVKNMGQEVPMHTQVLMMVSSAFVNFWYLFLLFPMVTGLVIFYRIQRDPEFHVRFDGWMLRLPIVGIILKKIILSRFANCFAIMYSSGIAVLDCMRVGEEVVGNKTIEQAIRSASRQIADGSGISAGFSSTGLFPPLVLRMLRIGENTGSLETALANISYFYTRDVRESIERLQTMIEPAMTIVVGLLLGWVMISVLGPIYDLISKIKI
jgi:type IV pilus assembly protein PilC